MNILMIPSWYGTKTAPLLGSFYKEQAEELAARGHRVAVLYAEVGGSFRPADNQKMHDVVNGVETYIWVKPNLTPRWEKGRCFQRTWMRFIRTQHCTSASSPSRHQKIRNRSAYMSTCCAHSRARAQSFPMLTSTPCQKSTSACPLCQRNLAVT